MKSGYINLKNKKIRLKGYNTRKEKTIYNRIYHKNITIGCMGLGRGVGTTSTCIALAGCLLGVYGLRIALVECNGHNDYIKIRQMAKKQYNRINEFEYRDITFYGRTDEAKISRILAENYDIVILDMEYGDGNWENLFMSCDIKLAVAGLNMWRIGYLKLFLKEYKNMISDISFMAFTYSERLVRKIYKEYKIQIKKFPYEEDVFCIQAFNIPMYQDILNI